MALVGLALLAVVVAVVLSLAREVRDIGAANDESDGSFVPTATALTTTTSAVPATSAPPVCADLASDYLDTFFALGAGTPEDPDATTVRLPVAELLAIDEQARRAGCRDFIDVACSAYAELDDQGLEAVNSQAPAGC